MGRMYLASLCFGDSLCGMGCKSTYGQVRFGEEAAQQALICESSLSYKERNEKQCFEQLPKTLVGDCGRTGLGCRTSRSTNNGIHLLHVAFRIVTDRTIGRKWRLQCFVLVRPFREFDESQRSFHSPHHGGPLLDRVLKKTHWN